MFRLGNMPVRPDRSPHSSAELFDVRHTSRQVQLMQCSLRDVKPSTGIRCGGVAIYILQHNATAILEADPSPSRNSLDLNSGG